MGSPIGHPANQGNGIDQFKAQVIGWIRAEIANAARGGVGLHVDGATGNLIADRGNLQSGNFAPGSAGWGLEPNGDASFGGNLSVSGTTTVSGANGIQSSNFVPGVSGWNLTGTQVEIDTGAIGNSALVHPISFDGNGGATTNFAVSTTGSGVALGAVTNTVPAGMTKMASFVVGCVTAVNPTASLDYLECRVGIIDPGSVNYAGNTQYQPVSGSNGSGQVSASKYGLLTGLSGGQHVTHYVSAWSANANWAANASNIADVQAIILWGA